MITSCSIHNSLSFHAMQMLLSLFSRSADYSQAQSVYMLLKYAIKGKNKMHSMHIYNSPLFQYVRKVSKTTTSLHPKSANVKHDIFGVSRRTRPAWLPCPLPTYQLALRRFTLPITQTAPRSVALFNQWRVPQTKDYIFAAEACVGMTFKLKN